MQSSLLLHAKELLQLILIHRKLLWQDIMQVCTFFTDIFTEVSEDSTLNFFSAIYGVEERIEFIVGDYFEIIQTLRPDVVFLSPPWGGPEYLDQETFDLANMSGLDGIKIFNDAAKLTKNIAYFVPRNTDGASLAKLAGEGGRKSI